jgi:hypothetical protein
MSADAFIFRWSKASPSERANSQLFLSELCDLLGVEHPDPSRGNGYCFGNGGLDEVQMLVCFPERNHATTVSKSSVQVLPGLRETG